MSESMRRVVRIWLIRVLSVAMALSFVPLRALAAGGETEPQVVVSDGAGAEGPDESEGVESRIQTDGSIAGMSGLDCTADDAEQMGADGKAVQENQSSGAIDSGEVEAEEGSEDLSDSDDNNEEGSGDSSDSIGDTRLTVSGDESAPIVVSRKNAPSASASGGGVEVESNDNESSANGLALYRPIQATLGMGTGSYISDTDNFYFVIEESSYVKFRISGSFMNLDAFYDVSVGRYGEDGKTVDSWFRHWNSAEGIQSLVSDTDLSLGILDAGRYCISIMFVQSKPASSVGAEKYKYSILVDADPVNKTDISDATVQAIPDQVFSGKALTPSVVVTYDGKELRCDQDFSVRFEDNVEVGTASVTIVGMRKYEGVLSTSFGIVLPQCDIDETLDLTDGEEWQGSKAIAPGHGVAATFTVEKDSLGLISTEIGYTSIEDYSGSARGELWYHDEISQNWTLIDAWLVRRVSGPDTVVPTFINVPLSMRAGQYRYVVASNEQNEVTLNLVGYRGAGNIEEAGLEEEPNQSMDRATPLRQGGMVYGTINRCGADIAVRDCDWYRLSLDEDMHVVLPVYFPLAGSAGASLALQLVDSNGELMRHSITREALIWTESSIQADEGTARLDCGVLKRGTYYLEVAGEVSGDGVTPLTSVMKSLLYYSVELNCMGGNLENAVVKNIPSQTYCGLKLTPSITVTKDDVTLIEGVDYTVSYSDNIDAGTAIATISGIGAYQGSVTKEFEVKPLSLSTTFVSAPVEVYTGSPIVPSSLSVLSGKRELEIVEGVDYEIINVNNNTDASELISDSGAYGRKIDGVMHWFTGSCNLRVRGINNYTGVGYASIDILMKRVAIPEAAEAITYDGTPKTGVPAGEGYRLTGTSSAVNAGTYTATASISDYKNYLWDTGADNTPKTITWSIAPASLEGAHVSTVKTLPYEGEPLTPTPVVLAEGVTLTPGVDYEVSYSDNVRCGTAGLTVTGVGNYTGMVSTTFEIVKAPQMVTTEKPSYSLAMGRVLDLDAVASGGGALSYRVVSGGAYARVSQKGEVTPVKAGGTATIAISAAATNTHESGSAIVEVVTTKGTPRIVAGDVTVTATKRVALIAKTVTGVGMLSFRSSNAKVAKVSASGVVTGRTAGTAVITIASKASANWYVGQTKVKVTVAKAANPLKPVAKAKKVAVEYQTAKTKAVKLASNVRFVTRAVGKVSYKNTAHKQSGKEIQGKRQDWNNHYSQGSQERDLYYQNCCHSRWKSDVYRGFQDGEL